MIEIDRAFHEKIRAYGAAAYKKFLCNEVIKNWSRLVDESFAEKILPVTIEHGVLFVRAENSAIKDQLKFFKEEIIDAINENFAKEEPLVKEIRIAKSFQVAPSTPEKKSSAKVNKLTVENVTLTEEEIKRCEERAEKFSEEFRPTILETLLSQAKKQKFRRANAWHKCAKCNALCPPEEILCEVCRIKERDAMTKKLFDIFCDAPWLNSQDAQKILLKQMPHMRTECSLDAIDSARTSLIQNLASRVRFGDENSRDVLKLVMLQKRLPPEKITPAIIKRALNELQFNLAELPKFPRKSFGK